MGYRVSATSYRFFEIQIYREITICWFRNIHETTYLR